MAVHLLVKNISKCLFPLKLKLSARVLSVSSISLNNKSDDELEIEDYERVTFETEEPVLAQKKFVAEEEEKCNLPDKIPLIRHYNKVAVLLPWVKWGPKKRYNVSSHLLLEESCALVKSLPCMEIIYKECVNLSKIVQNKIFTTGTLNRLVEEVNFLECDAVFISLNYLKRNEIETLEVLFNKRVFDRYMVVLDIFRYHARSAESKMQITIAEMPYLRRGVLTNNQKLWAHALNYELKTKLTKVSHVRHEIRSKRKKLSQDSIAVIGYTNCGKTTLIRGLTRDFRLVGENRLFATLDVTSHPTVLPCGLTSYFVDTVGFIQDIPTNLIAAFKSTLEDAIYADVIVYMRDISHPDFACQHAAVTAVLASLDIPKSTPMVVVNSKCDLINEQQMEEAKLEHGLEDSINVSAVTGEGMFHMLRVIESKLLEVTKRKKLRLKLLIGSSKISWLKENIGIQEEAIDEDDINYSKVVVAMNATEISAYVRAFKS